MPPPINHRPSGVLTEYPKSAWYKSYIPSAGATRTRDLTATDVYLPVLHRLSYWTDKMTVALTNRLMTFPIITRNVNFLFVCLLVQGMNCLNVTIQYYYTFVQSNFIFWKSAHVNFGVTLFSAAKVQKWHREMQIYDIWRNITRQTLDAST